MRIRQPRPIQILHLLLGLLLLSWGTTISAISVNGYYKTYQNENCHVPPSPGYALDYSQVDTECNAGRIKAYKTIIIVEILGIVTQEEGSCTPCDDPDASETSDYESGGGLLMPEYKEIPSSLPTTPRSQSADTIDDVVSTGSQSPIDRATENDPQSPAIENQRVIYAHVQSVNRISDPAA